MNTEIEGALSVVMKNDAVKGIPALLSKDVIKEDQNGIRAGLVSLDVRIHANLIQCYLHAQKHGDTSLVRRLLMDIVDAKSGYRRQGIIAHMRRFTPMELHGDAIKLTGTINGQPIPWDIETAHMTPFTSIPDFAEQIILKPVFKGGFEGQIARAVKAYKASIENTLVKDGKVVGPIDPKKPYYSGIHLDKMDTIFDEISAAAAKFETFKDDTAEVVAARKAVAENETFLKAKEAEVEAQAKAPEPVQGN